MKKLWETDIKLDTFIETFETKYDLLLDQRLLRYDVYGSIAQAKMLTKIGILKESEIKLLRKGLIEILKLNESDKFNLEFGDEDVHTKIENFLTNKYGDIGKKIHTGRSRNDQVLTAIRIFTKENLLEIWQELIILIDVFLAFAQKYEFVAMPGYTHTQKAMPSSFGMWAGAFVEGLLDDLKILKVVYELNNQSPLGSAAGYGVPLELDRKYCAKLLGFEKVQNNALYCQNSRGKIEAAVLSSFISILQSINKFASDVVLFTTSEFNYLLITETLCSGSSIMPQKKNVDIAELLRSKVHLVLGYYTQLVSLSSNLISGYNRDLQDSKKPLFESLQVTYDSIRAATILIKNITPNEEVLKKALTSEIFATHKALVLVKKGESFRNAYQKVKTNGLDSSSIKIESAIKQSAHIGGTGNLRLQFIVKTLDNEKEFYKQQKAKYKYTINNLIKGGGDINE